MRVRKFPLDPLLAKTRVKWSFWGMFGLGFLCLIALNCTLAPASEKHRQPTLKVPPRSPGALTGSQFAARATGKSIDEREELVFIEVTRGNIPDFLRCFHPVQVTKTATSGTNVITFYTALNYLAVGSNEDYLFVPVRPQTAQRIADALDCILPTPKMVDAIWAAAAIKLSPLPIPPSPAMTAIPVFSNHSAMVRAQLAELHGIHPPLLLVAGLKKDVVVTGKLQSSPGKVAIYGWHRTNGEPIQPLYLGHSSQWVDYSQCVRLIFREGLLNGRPCSLSELLRDPESAPLLSDDGPIAGKPYQ